jgi:hypothetical protein
MQDAFNARVVGPKVSGIFSCSTLVERLRLSGHEHRYGDVTVFVFMTA